MKKDDLVKEMASLLQLSQIETKRLFDVTFDELSKVLSQGNTFNIQGFGTFSVKEVEERKGFNPFIQKWMMLPKKLRVRFKTSERLKEKINQK